MALQTRNLAMVGLGVQGDSPPNELQPPLKDGVHLRWAFKRELGFPWHGYYLFRRNHRPGALVPARLSRVVDVELHGRRYRLCDIEEAAYRVQIRFDFSEAGRITVAALMWGTEVDESTIEGRAGETQTVNLAYDTITSIRFSLGPAVLGALLSVTVSAEARLGWEFVPAFPYPMRLPVSQPDYPCTAGMHEDLGGARIMAASRIRYGDPAELTAPPTSGYTRGTVSVTNGSSIVSGHATRWNENGVGAVLQVDGDPTAYTITRIVDTEKLNLSRGYFGPSRAGVPYTIHQDHFGQLHDHLVQLVEDGPALGLPMALRSLPQIIYETGTVELTDGSRVVRGVGTAWTEDLVGLDLQVVGAYAGTIRVRNGFYTVSGTGTHWHSDVAGMSLRVAGNATGYTIEIHESPTDIVLDRPFAGISADDMPYRIFERAVYPIAEFVSATELRLARAYHGPLRPGPVPYAIFSALQSPGRGRQPWMPHQFPLDSVLLATLHPAMAQLLGLYWVDSQAKENHPYDYLILADHEGSFSGDPQRAIGFITSNEISALPGVDGYIVFNRKRALASPLSPPGGLRAYALPAGGRKPATPNNAGLAWDTGATGGVLLPDKAVFAHLWRAELGEAEPADLPARESYRPITAGETGEHPLLISAPVPGLFPERPADWPPFPMMATDRELEDGWYSYRISGIDIFGRHSQQSDAARWHQWDPVPDPKPWYYQDPPGEREIHSFAVRLLDKIPPPPPAGIEGYALDPADPTVMKDAAYHAWHDSLSPEDRDTLVGLRVRWLWSVAHMAQAPETREFRIYYQPGRLNAVLGDILDVAMLSLEESEVTVAIPNGHPAVAYVGALLQTGPNAFKVMGASGAGELCLRVKNIGPHYRVGTLTTERDSPSVEGVHTTWRSDLTGMVLQVDGETTPYRIAQVLSPTRLTLETPYAGTTGAEKRYQIFKLPRQGVPCSLVAPSPYSAGRVLAVRGSREVSGRKTYWGPEFTGQAFKLAGEHDAYRIVDIIDIDADSSLQQITLDRPYTGRATGERPYTATHPLFVDYTAHTNWDRRIHVVGYDEHVQERIPAMRDTNGYPLTGPRATIAGSTASLRNSAGDGPTEADLSTVDTRNAVLYLENDRAPGNKRYRIQSVDNVAKTVTVHGTPDIGTGSSLWIIGPPVPLRFYEVFLPATDIAEGGRYAPSLADPVVYAHIGISAVDGRAHTADDPRWAEEERGGWEPEERYGNEGRVGPPVSIFRVRRERPGAPIPPLADSDRVYATPADYKGNSFYSYRWQPVTDLKAQIFRALDDSVFKVDWARRETNPYTLSPTDEEVFPAELSGDDPDNVSRREAVSDEINYLNTFDHDAAGKKLALACYRGLSNDALRVLAGLPGNERAFTQITIQPLDPNDPSTADLRGPDDPEGYTPNTGLRVYMDTLPGRSTNRYFYRAAYVDGAQNRSNLSLASPPVYLPKVTLPRTPVITKVLGGDRRITLRWNCSRKPDLVEYRVYRTDKNENIRDIRLMPLVHTETLPPGDVTECPRMMQWIDEVPGFLSFYYRLVALDSSGNVSKPSKIVAGRAFDHSPPEPVEWRRTEWGRLDAWGNVHPRDSAVENGTPVVSLEWTTNQPTIKCLVQRRQEDSSNWLGVSSWLSSSPTDVENGQWILRFSDLSVLAVRCYWYRIVSVNKGGKPSVSAEASPDSGELNHA